jgi:hypothetical protein
MNWIRSQGDGARGSATIPPGSIVKGIVVGFQVRCAGGNQTGGVYDVGIFKAGALVASKAGSIGNGASVGPFGSSTDLWGLGALATPTYFTNMYFGVHPNFPNITSEILVSAWDGYMDIYYDDPVPTPASISVGAGNNQSAVINTQFAQQLYAIVRDQGGVPMPGISVTFTLPASGASGGFNSAGGPKTATATTNSSGGAVSPFFFANATTGNWQPVADVTGSSPLIFTLFQATNSPVPPVLVPTTISKLLGDGQQAAVGTAFAVQQKVKVFDQFVHAMNNVEITWPVPGSGPRGTYAGGTPAHTFTDINGIATAPVLTANLTSGAWTEAAFPTGFAAVVASFGFTNLANNAPPTATTLQVVQGNNQSAALSTNFAVPIQIKVLDQYSSPVAGVSVTGTIPSAANGAFVSGGGQVGVAVTNASGIAGFGQITAGGVVSAGWNLSMTATGTGGVSVGTFKNVDAVIPMVLEIAGGNNQIATPNTAFAQPLRVRVTNGLGNGIQNYGVTFTAPGSSASCTFTGGVSSLLVLTDINGYAQTTATANANEGTYNVTVSASGLTSITFAMQNGNTYAAEVCTAFVVTGGGINVAGSGVGTSPTAWSNPSSCIATAGGGSFAANREQPPNSNRSQTLQPSPIPANWTAIPNDAKITQVKLSFSARGVNATGTFGTLFTSFSGMTGGASQSVVGITTAFANFTRTITPLALTTAADLKVAGVGWNFVNAPASGTGAGTGFDINGVTVSVCYQTVIPPPTQPAVPPLLLCGN